MPNFHFPPPVLVGQWTGSTASAFGEFELITLVPFIFCSDNGNRVHFAVIVLHTFTYKCASTAVGHTYKRYIQNIFMLSKHKRRILQIHIAENTVNAHIYLNLPLFALKL